MANKQAASKGGQRRRNFRTRQSGDIVSRLLEAVRQNDRMTMVNLTESSNEGAIGSVSSEDDNLLKMIARSHYDLARIRNITLCRFPKDDGWQVAEFHIKNGKVQLPLTIYA